MTSNIPDPGQTAASLATETLRSEEVQRQLKQISARDPQLWSIGLLTVVVLASGFAALVAPNTVWHGLPGVGRVEYRFLPQFFFSVTALILLVNIYTLMQKRGHNATRAALIRVHREEWHCD